MKKYNINISFEKRDLVWISELPSNWKHQRGKWLFKKEQRSVRPIDEIVTAFRDGQVTLRKNRRVVGFTEADKEHGYQGVRIGDLVIHEMDAFAGAIGISDSDGKSTPVYSVCTPKGRHIANSRFFMYFLRDIARAGYIQSLAKGIRERSTDFRFNDFGNILLPLPSIEYQNKAVDFLDIELLKIDELIKKQEYLIKLLKEKRHALISYAVTKGITKNVKMKDSCIQHLGEIPATWEIVKLKHIAKILPSNVDKKSIDGESSILLCNYVDVYRNESIDSTIDFMRATATNDQINKFTLIKNDILITKDSEDPFDIGIPSIVSETLENVICGYHLAIIRCSNDVFSTYLKRVIESSFVKYYFATNANGLTRYGLGSYAIKNLQIPLPPEEESAAIGKFLDEKCNKIDQTISISLKMIEILKEKKQSIISNVVTGKINVID